MKNTVGPYINVYISKYYEETVISRKCRVATIQETYL